MGFYQKMGAERAARQANAADGVRPKYKVLQVDMLKSVDKERAAAVSSFVRSGEEAYKLEGQEGFSYCDLDLRGRCGVVRYRGVEVALLFKREVVEREPAVAEPVPERVLSHPFDAWLQIDLLGVEEFEKKKGIGDRLRQALAQVERLKMLWQSEEGQRKQLEEQLSKRVDERAELKALREKVAMLEARLQLSDKEIENWKRETMTQKESRKNDKMNTVRELVPVFNTTWLAGRHRVEDQLYGIIRKQMTEGLAKIGVVLIEPEVGERFDPEQHHAVHCYQFDTGAKEIGTIVMVHRVGWKMGSLVVDAAEVAVGVEKKKEEQDGSGTGTVAVGDVSAEEETSGSATEVGRVDLPDARAPVVG